MSSDTPIPAKKYDIVGFDDALVDEFYQCSQEHLENAGVKIGGTIFPDHEKTEALIGNLPCTLRMSGGSAANTLSHMQKAGDKTAFMGLIGKGATANRFTEDLKRTGVDVYPIPTDNPKATGRCVSFVNPGGERTMATSLPRDITITKDQINEDLLKQTKLLYTTAYLWNDCTKEALEHAFDVTHAAGGKVAFTLSAAGKVETIREDILRMLNEKKIDLLFGNEQEFTALFHGKNRSDVIDAACHLTENGSVNMVGFTMGGRGSLLMQNGKPYPFGGSRCDVVDTTGAGDAYAAGIMHSIHKKPDEKQHIYRVGNLAGRWASEVLQHYGARQPDHTPSESPKIKITGKNSEYKGTPLRDPNQRNF